MGQTTQATGSAALSNGQTQPVTSGWLSDATAVATVTDAGLVTGVSNGRATIYVVSGGRQGQQVITATPSYGSFAFPVVSAPIRDDGSSAFTSTASLTDSGITLMLEANWVINSPRAGDLSGTVNEVWRFPNVSGEGRLAQSIVQTGRSSTTAVSGRGGSAKTRAMQKLAGQDR